MNGGKQAFELLDNMRYNKWMYRIKLILSLLLSACLLLGGVANAAMECCMQSPENGVSYNMQMQLDTMPSDAEPCHNDGTGSAGTMADSTFCDMCWSCVSSPAIFVNPAAQGYTSNMAIFGLSSILFTSKHPDVIYSPPKFIS